MSHEIKRPRVLLVDDDEGVLRAFKRIFAAQYEVTPVTSAEAALRMLAEHPFDAAVLDHQMPGMTGAELARRLEVEHPALPRLMLTGYPGLQELVALREANLVAAVLVKPWEAADVRHAIDLALAKAARRQAAPG